MIIVEELTKEHKGVISHRESRVRVAAGLHDPDSRPPLSPQGYMMKKGHKRKNWTERWFMLKPSSISYYVGEDLAEQKGDILLDGRCCVEARTRRFYRKSSTYLSTTEIRLISETRVYEAGQSKVYHVMGSSY